MIVAPTEGSSRKLACASCRLDSASQILQSLRLHQNDAQR
jgi:hypothetical protein